MENNNSIWKKEGQNNRKFRTLEQNIETDVCVIGGGIAGMSVAYYLAKEGKKVAVLEKDRICSKTSGGTTGKITSQHHLFYNYLIQSQNKDFAKKYLKANEEAIQNIEEIIQTEKIDCDFERKSAFVWTKNLDKLQMIKAEVDSLKSLGKNPKFTNEIEILGKIEGAIEFENQAQFHPVKYVNGLAKSILENGGEIFENTKVVEYQKRDIPVPQRNSDSRPPQAARPPVLPDSEQAHIQMHRHTHDLPSAPSALLPYPYIRMY